MPYEVPSEQLESAFDTDVPLQKLLTLEEESEESFAKKAKDRDETVTRLKGELVVEAAQARKLVGLVKGKRHRIKILSKKKRPPSLANLRRRIIRRKATIRDQLLRQYLSTQKEDFLEKWRRAHGKGSENEISEET